MVGLAEGNLMKDPERRYELALVRWYRPNPIGRTMVAIGLCAIGAVSLAVIVYMAAYHG